jgi:3-isopropylmalate dehydrogenase
MLRYSLGMVAAADLVEKSVLRVLEDGYRTYDIMSEGMTKVGTRQMGDLIVKKVAEAK